MLVWFGIKRLTFREEMYDWRSAAAASCHELTEHDVRSQRWTRSDICTLDPLGFVTDSTNWNVPGGDGPPGTLT